jgi:hypothetical protein
MTKNTKALAVIKELQDFHKKHQLWLDKEIQTLSANEKEDFARANGYIKWRDLEAATNHVGRIVNESFSSDCFNGLWQQLEVHDRACDGFALSTANGGVPSKIINAVFDWYKTPKFTKTEEAAHDKKINKCCDELLRLLNQISSGGNDKFSFFRELEEWQVSSLFTGFKSPKRFTHYERQKRRSKPDVYGRKFSAGYLLNRSGITPQYALLHLKRATEKDSVVNKMPTKIRSRTAINAYLIDQVEAVTGTSTAHGDYYFCPYELMADIVGSMSGIACEPDDVRKRLSQRRTEVREQFAALKSPKPRRKILPKQLKKSSF